MASLDTLPADQRAVVGLLLRQGKSYDELSGLLRLDAATVRERAHAALGALGPQDANGLDAERRAELADFLLGQGSEADHEAARVFLAGSPSGRAWARGVAVELAPVASEGLPEVPAEPAPAASEPAPAPSEPSPAAPPRVSRRGGAILLGVLAVLVAAGVAAALLLGGSSGGGDDHPAASASRTTAASTPSTSTPSTTTTKVRAQANLTAPAGAPAPKALGVIQVVEVKGQRQLLAIVQGLPRPGRHEGFGIWLTAPGGRQMWLGFFQSTDKQGRLIAQGALRQPITGFDQMLVTRETGATPKRPGRAYLRGRIQRPASGSGP